MRKQKIYLLVIMIVLVFWGAVHVNAAVKVSSDESNMMVAEYSDSYFKKNATKKSNDLTQLSIVAAHAAYKDTTAFLQSCGFDNIVDKQVIPNDPTEKIHMTKVTLGHKTVSSSGEKYDLYAILIRGTVGTGEWISNLDVSSLNKKSADQFAIPKKEVNKLFQWFRKQHSTSGAKTKVWITGHSRGAAIANLLAHDLSNTYSASNVYAYTFACPKVVKKKTKDANIFNYIIQEDIVPQVPPTYKRYGTDIVLNTKGHMDMLCQQMTGEEYKGTVGQAHHMETYMCAFMNTITFPDENTKISISLTSKILYPKQNVALKATVTGSASKVKWKSSNKKVATVNSKGKVTAKKAGTATITAYVTGNDKKIKKATCTITVKKNKIKLNMSEALLYTTKSNVVKLKATVSGNSSKVTWKSSNTKIATVSSNGLVKAKKAGTVTITAKANGVKAKCKVIVKKVKKNNYKQIYQKFIADKKYMDYVNDPGETNAVDMNYRFAYVDIDKDDVEELIVDAMNRIGWYNDLIFTYDKNRGNVRYIGSVYTYNSVEYSKEYAALSYNETRPMNGEYVWKRVKLQKYSLYDDNKYYYNNDTFELLDWKSYSEII